MLQVINSKSSLCLTLLVAALGIFAVAGCGGDGDGDANGTTDTQAADGATSAANGDSQGSNGSDNGEQGSEDGAAGGASGDVSAQFVATADAACARSAKRFQKEARKKLFGETAEESGGEAKAIEDLVNQVSIPRLEEQIADLHSLEGSENEEAAADEVAAGLEQGVSAIKADPEAFFYGTVKELTAAQQLAAGFGFKRCGSL